APGARPGPQSAAVGEAGARPGDTRAPGPAPRRLLRLPGAARRRAAHDAPDRLAGEPRPPRAARRDRAAPLRGALYVAGARGPAGGGARAGVAGPVARGAPTLAGDAGARRGGVERGLLVLPHAGPGACAPGAQPAGGGLAGPRRPRRSRAAVARAAAGARPARAARDRTGRRAGTCRLLWCRYAQEPPCRALRWRSPLPCAVR